MHLLEEQSQERCCVLGPTCRMPHAAAAARNPSAGARAMLAPVAQIPKRVGKRPESRRDTLPGARVALLSWSQAAITRMCKGECGVVLHARVRKRH